MVRIYTFLRGLPRGLLGTPGSTFGCCFAVFSLNRALMRGGSSGAAGLSFEWLREESLIWYPLRSFEVDSDLLIDALLLILLELTIINIIYTILNLIPFIKIFKIRYSTFII